MPRAKSPGLADYVLLLQREWEWGLKWFVLLSAFGAFGVGMGYVFFVPREGYVATAKLIVSDKGKERTLAQLNSQLWAELATNGNPVQADVSHGLVRLQVESWAAPELALGSAKSLLSLLQQTRKVEQAERNAALMKALSERDQLAPTIGHNRSAELRYQELSGQIVRWQEEILALAVEVIDPPTVRPLATPRHPWKSLTGVAVMAILVSISGVFIREWWRLEMRRRGRNA